MKIMLQRKKETPSKTLEDICSIKSKRWNYTQDQCKVWIEENLEEDDYHLCIYIKNNIIAYMNFVFIEAKVNDSIIPFVGIGNVCTAESGKGYGDLLMKEVNKIIVEMNWKGILFCKDELVPYYQKFSWELVPAHKIQTDNFKGINFMVFNVSEDISNLQYDGRNF